MAGEERKVMVLIETRTKAKSVKTEGETMKPEEREIGADAKMGLRTVIMADTQRCPCAHMSCNIRLLRT